MNRTLHVVVGSFVLGLVACSSSSSSGTTPPIDSGTINDTGGPSDSGSGDTASPGDSGTTADAACTASAQAQCNRRDACTTNHYLINRTYGDMATCVARIHDSCMNGLAANGSGNTPDKVLECANAYGTISCTDYLNSNTTAFPAACQPQPGTLAAGAACHFNGQCGSAYCNVPNGTECGTCGPIPAVGDACNGPGGNSGCGAHLQQCVGAVSNDTAYTAGTCADIVTTVGGTCDTTHPCGTGLSCTPTSATATGRTCETAGLANAPCGGASNPGCDNDQGFTCNGKTHTCQATTVAGPGTACGTGSDGSFTNCLANGDCMGATSGSNAGTCRAAAADSAACDKVAGPNCGATSTCVTGGGTTTGGTCVFPNASACH